MRRAVLSPEVVSTILARLDPAGHHHLHGSEMQWSDDAACVGQEPELFFPIGTDGPALEQESEAKAVCNRCPVIDACLWFAMDTGQDAGIWGGMTEAERRILRIRMHGPSRAG